MTMVELKGYFIKRIKIIIIASILVGVLVGLVGTYLEKQQQDNLMYCSKSEIFIDETVKNSIDGRIVPETEVNKGFLLADSVIDEIKEKGENIKKDDIIVESDQTGRYLTIYAIGQTKDEAEKFNNMITEIGVNNIEKEKKVKGKILASASEAFAVEVLEIENGNSEFLNEKKIKIANNNYSNSSVVKHLGKNVVVGIILTFVLLIVWCALWKMIHMFFDMQDEDSK